MIFEGFSGPASSFHLLFDVDQKWPQDELQIAPRTLQDAPRCPTASNMGPTWAQHGVQESSKIGPRGVKLLSRGGHQLRLLSDRSHGPHMDPKCTPNEPQVGVMLGSSWGRLGVILGSSWDHFGVILGSSAQDRSRAQNRVLERGFGGKSAIEVTKINDF